LSNAKPQELLSLYRAPCAQLGRSVLAEADGPILPRFCRADDDFLVDLLGSRR
jgi:hypothetical protein